MAEELREVLGEGRRRAGERVGGAWGELGACLRTKISMFWSDIAIHVENKRF